MNPDEPIRRARGGHMMLSMTPGIIHFLLALLALLAPSTQVQSQQCPSLLTTVSMEVPHILLATLCRSNGTAELVITCHDTRWSGEVEEFCTSSDLSTAHSQMVLELKSPALTIQLMKGGNLLDVARVLLLPQRRLDRYKISVWGQNKTRFVLSVSRMCDENGHTKGHTEQFYRDKFSQSRSNGLDNSIDQFSDVPTINVDNVAMQHHNVTQFAQYGTKKFANVLATELEQVSNAETTTDNPGGNVNSNVKYTTIDASLAEAKIQWMEKKRIEFENKMKFYRYSESPVYESKDGDETLFFGENKPTLPTQQHHVQNDVGGARHRNTEISDLNYVDDSALGESAQGTSGLPQHYQAQKRQGSSNLSLVDSVGPNVDSFKETPISKDSNVSSVQIDASRVTNDPTNEVQNTVDGVSDPVTPSGSNSLTNSIDSTLASALPVLGEVLLPSTSDGNIERTDSNVIISSPTTNTVISENSEEPQIQTSEPNDVSSNVLSDTPSPNTVPVTSSKVQESTSITEIQYPTSSASEESNSLQDTTLLPSSVVANTNIPVSTEGSNGVSSTTYDSPSASASVTTQHSVPVSTATPSTTISPDLPPSVTSEATSSSSDLAPSTPSLAPTSLSNDVTTPGLIPSTLSLFLTTRDPVVQTTAQPTIISEVSTTGSGRSTTQPTSTEGTDLQSDSSTRQSPIQSSTQLESSDVTKETILSSSSSPISMTTVNTVRTDDIAQTSTTAELPQSATTASFEPSTPTSPSPTTSLSTTMSTDTPTTSPSPTEKIQTYSPTVNRFIPTTPITTANSLVNVTENGNSTTERSDANSMGNDTFWPVVAAMVVGIPSVVVLGIAIVVFHRRRRPDLQKIFSMKAMKKATSQQQLQQQGHHQQQQHTIYYPDGDESPQQQTSSSDTDDTPRSSMSVVTQSSSVDMEA